MVPPSAPSGRAASAYQDGPRSSRAHAVLPGCSLAARTARATDGGRGRRGDGATGKVPVPPSPRPPVPPLPPLPLSPSPERLLFLQPAGVTGPGRLRKVLL